MYIEGSFAAGANTYRKFYACGYGAPTRYLKVSKKQVLDMNDSRDSFSFLRYYRIYHYRDYVASQAAQPLLEIGRQVRT